MLLTDYEVFLNITKCCEESSDKFKMLWAVEYIKKKKIIVIVRSNLSKTEIIQLVNSMTS